LGTQTYPALKGLPIGLGKSKSRKLYVSLVTKSQQFQICPVLSDWTSNVHRAAGAVVVEEDKAQDAVAEDSEEFPKLHIQVSRSRK
jgi:hypothetical protein